MRNNSGAFVLFLFLVFLGCRDLTVNSIFSPNHEILNISRLIAELNLIVLLIKMSLSLTLLLFGFFFIFGSD